MRNHLSFRSGNPALNSNTFSGLGYSSSIHSSERMTIDGTVNKTAISISILMIAAYYTYISQNTGWIVIPNLIKIPIAPFLQMFSQNPVQSILA